jgi:heavy metal efflux system protein
LSALLLPNRVSETETLAVRGLRRLYSPLVAFALANRVLTLGGAGLLIVMALLAMRSLGLEFLPHLEEGNLWIRATMPPSISLERGNGYVNRMREIIKSFPEVMASRYFATCVGAMTQRLCSFSRRGAGCNIGWKRCAWAPTTTW